jgi:hypothetical protein
MSSICLSKRWLAQVTASIRFACTRFNPAWASGFRGGPFLGAKSAAPRKRSMVAWRRRPNPRVMQCPRQQLCLDGMEKVQRGQDEFVR